MAILDDILAILKGANPSADDATLQSQAAQLASHPDAASVMSPFDVSTSDNTVTQNGAVPTSPADYPAKLGMSDIPTPDSLDLSKLPAPPASVPTTPPAAPPVASPTPSAAPTLAPSAAQKPPVPSGAPVDSSDNDRRQALLDAANRKAKLASIPAAIAGIGGAVGDAAQAFGVHPEGGAEDRILNRAQQNLALNKTGIEDQISNDPNSEASKSARALVLQIAPDMANQPGFNTMSDKELRDKLPLVDTMMKARAAEDAKKLSLAQIKSNRDLSLGLREDQQQDKLEQNAKQMVSNLRGDKSLARAEEQRDAAIVAYNRINEIQKSGGSLNPVDYVDILGQVYKARTGAAPGEQVLKDIRQATAEGSLGKAYTFATGKQAPATSQEITNSLKNMASSMGSQADMFHDNYMKAHLIKPSSLEDSRWKPIADTGRGISFADATKVPAAGGQSSSSDPLGIR